MYNGKNEKKKRQTKKNFLFFLSIRNQIKRHPMYGKKKRKFDGNICTNFIYVLFI